MSYSAKKFQIQAAWEGLHVGIKPKITAKGSLEGWLEHLVLPHTHVMGDTAPVPMAIIDMGSTLRQD